MAVVRHIAAIVLMALCATAGAQELLVPAGRWQQKPAAKAKSTTILTLPFFDDFSDYDGVPIGNLWAPGDAYVGTDYGALPPTVGVMTLDALDADGYLHEEASTSLFSADTAMSLPIRLDGLDSNNGVVMSFYYLPGGGGLHPWESVGDTPDPSDSLFLDFYCTLTDTWHTVWSRGGTSVAQLRQETGKDWQYVAIKITDSRYLDSAFRFRFRNYCSLENNGKKGMMGNVDQWNIDYVLIDRGRTIDSVPAFRDIAFVKPAPTMLKHYRAMPARQYRASDMATTLSMTIANLYSSPIASYYSYRVEDSSGAVLYTYDGGYQNAPAEGYQTEPVHAMPSVGYTFPQSDTPVTYAIVHNVREGATGDDFPQNDTVCYYQHFSDYYAYDDGTAENGYGLTSTAATVSLAYRFDLNTADTLSAIDMAFNRTFDCANCNIRFRLTVWRAENGLPGTMLYIDQNARTPIIPDSAALDGGRSAFFRYVLEHNVVVDGSIFVGFVQEGSDYMNIGFDRSFNSADRIYYYTSDTWQQSFLSGSLMIRPCFGQSAIVSIASAESENVTLTLYPNPADREVRIDGLPYASTVTVYDISGRKVLTVGGDRIDTSCLTSGIYMVRAITTSGTLHTAKLIIRH